MQARTLLLLAIAAVAHLVAIALCRLMARATRKKPGVEIYIAAAIPACLVTTFAWTFVYTTFFGREPGAIMIGLLEGSVGSALVFLALGLPLVLVLRTRDRRRERGDAEQK